MFVSKKLLQYWQPQAASLLPLVNSVEYVDHEHTWASPSAPLKVHPVPCACLQPRVLRRLLLTRSNAFQWGKKSKNCPLPWGDPSRNLMVPPESKTQTASRSVHLFVVTDRYTQTMTHDMRKLLVPRTHNKLGDRNFSAAGPRLWNDLPPGLRRSGLPSTPSDNLKNSVIWRPKRLVTLLNLYAL